MPLIIMVGIPCSGKSTRAKLIAKFLEEEKKLEVQIVNEELLGLEKSLYLKDPQ